MVNTNMINTATAATLAQHIRALSPEKGAARLSFLNFLSFVAEPNQPVDDQLLQRFLSRALQFAHWREQKRQLCEEVASVVSHFQQKQGVRIAVERPPRTLDLQPIEIESIHNLELVLAKYLKKSLPIDARFRVLRDTDERLIAVVLQANKSLRVTTYSKCLTLINGELQPLHEDFTLHYRAGVVLENMKTQSLDCGQNAVATFKINGSLLTGTLVRGYMFQKVESYSEQAIEKLPQIYYPLKRVEQFFIDRKTDPVYQDLTSSLERAVDLLNARHPEAEKYARWALERARFAFEHIYAGDSLGKLMTLLERLVSAERPQSARTSLSLNHQRSLDLHAHPEPDEDLPGEDLGIDLVEKAKWTQTQS